MSSKFIFFLFYLGDHSYCFLSAPNFQDHQLWPVDPCCISGRSSTNLVEQITNLIEQDIVGSG